MFTTCRGGGEQEIARDRNYKPARCFYPRFPTTRLCFVDF